MGRTRVNLRSGATAQSVPLHENSFLADSTLLLPRLESTVSLIDEMLAAHQSLSAYDLQDKGSEPNFKASGA